MNEEGKIVVLTLITFQNASLTPKCYKPNKIQTQNTVPYTKNSHCSPITAPYPKHPITHHPSLNAMHTSNIKYGKFLSHLVVDSYGLAVKVLSQPS